MADMLRIPNLSAPDSRLAELMFEFVQFLLDDDGNLTTVGNLTGVARQRFRTRVNELIVAEDSGNLDSLAEPTAEHTAAAVADSTEAPDSTDTPGESS
jgi:hypothetical protein